jgi:hypothetical protein
MEAINPYAEMFKFFREYYLRTGLIPLTEVSKLIFSRYYDMCIKAGLEKLENLPQEKKDQLISKAGQSRIRCKIIYLIENL